MANFAPSVTIYDLIEIAENATGPQKGIKAIDVSNFASQRDIHLVGEDADRVLAIVTSIFKEGGMFLIPSCCSPTPDAIKKSLEQSLPKMEEMRLHYAIKDLRANNGLTLENCETYGVNQNQYSASVNHFDEEQKTKDMFKNLLRKKDKRMMKHIIKAAAIYLSDDSPSKQKRLAIKMTRNGRSIDGDTMNRILGELIKSLLETGEVVSFLSPEQQREMAYDIMATEYGIAFYCSEWLYLIRDIAFIDKVRLLRKMSYINSTPSLVDFVRDVPIDIENFMEIFGENIHHLRNIIDAKPEMIPSNVKVFVSMMPKSAIEREYS